MERDRIPVRILDCPSSLTGQSQYTEWHLQYTRTRPPRWLPHLSATVAQVGDLTLSIDPLDCSFLGLDLYTNAAHWQPTDVPVPLIPHQATLQFVDCLEADDFLSYRGEPVVDSLAEENWLRIVLSRERADVHVVCADGVLAGIAGGATDGFLVDFWLKMPLEQHET